MLKMALDNHENHCMAVVIDSNKTSYHNNALVDLRIPVIPSEKNVCQFPQIKVINTFLLVKIWWIQGWLKIIWSKSILQWALTLTRDKPAKCKMKISFWLVTILLSLATLATLIYLHTYCHVGVKTFWYRLVSFPNQQRKMQVEKWTIMTKCDTDTVAIQFWLLKNINCLVIFKMTSPSSH